MKVILFSARGHGRSVYEIIMDLNYEVVAYAEKSVSNWIKNTPLIKNNEISNFPKSTKIAIGLEGTNLKQ